MIAPISDPAATLNGYQLRLPGFEGPLDVLLRLIERQQLVITDVSLVAVTDQFLAQLEAIGDAPAGVVAEFTSVGSRLVVLKSRSLLPRPTVDDEPEPEDLVQQLVAYRAMKAAAAHLAAHDLRGAGAFAPGDAIVQPDAPPPTLAMHQASWLARALRRRLTRMAEPSTPVSAGPWVTLREMTERLLAAMPGGRRLAFSRFSRQCADRREVLVAFLSILALMRRRVIEVEQRELFGAIVMEKTPPARRLAGISPVPDTHLVDD